jgi:pimeloyl-ACP methyl ester carboxylesterase
MAAMAPARVAVLVLADGPGVRDQLAPRILAPLIPAVLPWFVETRRGLGFVWRGVMARESRIDINALHAYLESARIRGHARGLSRMMTAPQGTRPSIAQIRQPVLVLTGELDGYLSPERARTLAAELPRAHVAIIPRAGHLPLEEQPDASAAAIREFLESRLPVKRPASATAERPIVREPLREAR